MHDVFISYEHESKSIADNVCSMLERNKIRCWYAPRDVIGDYATSIVDAIDSCKIFILILNENSSNSRHVLNEVESAYNSNSSPAIIPFKVDDKTLSKAMEYYVKRLHWIDASSKSLDSAIDELVRKVAPILNIELDQPGCEKTSSGKERIQNKYFSNDDVQETNRLRIQSALLKGFDQPVYDSVVEGRSNLHVLDIGSNNGAHIMDRLGDKDGIRSITGFEYDAQAVEHANNKYGSDSISFHQCDLEKPEFESALRKIMEEKGIESFDIINLSMIILHLKNPYKVMKTVRKYISPDGRIIVKDIDDGLNIAFPDPDGDFERTYRICDEDELSGFRHSGRQIHSLLAKIGMNRIVLEKTGLNTIGMDFSERQALFDTYFSFIREDLAILHEKYPDDENITNNLHWYEDNYDDLEEQFHSREFMFSLGFMIYTASL